MMIARRKSLRFLKRVVPLIVLLGMTYQLGACPCGCLEHNSWLQSLGLIDHDPIADHHPDSANYAGRRHACGGHLKFVDNAQRVVLRQACSIYWMGERKVPFETRQNHARGYSTAQFTPCSFVVGDVYAACQVFLL